MNVIWLLPVWIAVEIAAWVVAAHWISGWLVFWWTLVAVFIGLGMVKNSLGGLLPMMQQGRMPMGGMPQGNLGKALAGILIAIPGLLSDVLGLLLLLPPVQRRVQVLVQQVMLRHQDKIMQDAMRRMGGMNGLGGGAAGGFDPRMMEELMRQMGGGAAGGARRPDVVEGEARPVASNDPRIEYKQK